MLKNINPGHLKALKIAFFIGSALLVLASPGIAPARAFIINENFDSYTAGVSINGQGGWINPWPGNIGNPGIVSNEKSFSFYNSFKPGVNNGEGSLIYSASSSHFGILNFKIYVPNQTTKGVSTFAIVNYPTLNTGFIFTPFSNYPATGTASILNDYAGQNVCVFSMDNWYDIKIQFEDNTLGNRARYNCNNLGWTSWYGAQNSLHDINALVSYAGNTGTFFIDDLEINAGCGSYTDRETCRAQNCYWENVIFHEEQSYCRENTAGIDYCEYSVFGCAYCNSSTTCAGATGCFWNSLAGCSYIENVCEFEHLENCENSTDCSNASGTWNGDFCFVSQIAPEDCSTLPTLEKLVCEIKNFISSAFLPSKEKLSELGRTIDLINTKFPSNYLRSARIFFDDIKNGVNESAGIPVKIMGHQQNASFEVLNATGTAGAVSTIGNIFKTFFSLIFLGVFIAWAINFLQRIFK